MKTVFLFVFLLFVLQLNAQKHLEQSVSDSVALLLQASINNHYDDIDKYYQLENDINGESIEKIKSELIELKKQKTQTVKELQEISSEINDLLAKIEPNSEQGLNSKIIKDLDNKLKFQDKHYKDLRFIVSKISLKNEVIQKLVKLDELKLQSDNHRQEFATLVKKLPVGEYSFVFKNERYFAFITDPTKHRIGIINGASINENKIKGISIDKFILNRKNENYNVLMVTNGGMFDSDFLPVGLLIVNKKIINNINTGGEANSNFFMLPNGVFYIQNDSVLISETNIYINKKSNPDFATQSGPLLLKDGKQHYKFNYGSSNLYNRSGVGILPNNRAVFIISEKQNTNFFDFSSIFKDVFSCKDALYLDGAISEMYLKNNANIKRNGGSFGSLIYVEIKND